MDWHVTTEGQWQPALRDVICWGWLGVTEQPAGEVTPLPGKRGVPTPAVAAAPGQQPAFSGAVARIRDSPETSGLFRVVEVTRVAN